MLAGKSLVIYYRFESNWGFYKGEATTKQFAGAEGLVQGKTNLEERILVLLERFCILDKDTETFSWNPKKSWIVKK